MGWAIDGCDLALVVPISLRQLQQWTSNRFELPVACAPRPENKSACFWDTWSPTTCVLKGLKLAVSHFSGINLELLTLADGGRSNRATTRASFY